jgi:hypothetical protein
MDGSRLLQYDKEDSKNDNLLWTNCYDRSLDEKRRNISCWNR